MKFVLDAFGVERPRYLDIGAHHPRQLNNTYLLYRSGGSGVLVEPNPKWLPLIRKDRPHDVCLNVGLSARARQDVPFFVMGADTLCTFSQPEAQRMVEECGERIEDVLSLELVTPESILRDHFQDGLNYVSLDVEGLELDILRAFDFNRFRPEVISVETVSYSPDGGGQKDRGLIEFMEACGYLNYADTFINTIFVDRSRWEGLRRCEAENP